MKLLLFVAFFWLSYLPLSVQAAVPQQLIFYDLTGMRQMKTALSQDGEPELRKLYKGAAAWAIKQSNSTVTAKTVLPPSGDCRDYVSLSRYYWPDPDNPLGPYVSRDGITNPEREDTTRYDAVRMEKMASAVINLALSWYLSGEESYAAHAVEIVDQWFVSPATAMNPNMNFAQGIPGKSTGQPSGIIETVILIELTDAIRLLQTANVWTPERDEAVRAWFGSYVEWLMLSDLGRREERTLNNHAVWYDAQLTAFASFAGRPDNVRQVVEAARDKRIRVQIEPGGDMPRETARTRSLQYNLYNLKAFVTLARIGSLQGIDLWHFETADGRSIRAVLDRLSPYATGGSIWPKTSVITENWSGSASIFAMAAQAYPGSEFIQTAHDLVNEKRLRDYVAVRSFTLPLLSR
jgi:hypothetical protein